MCTIVRKIFCSRRFCCDTKEIRNLTTGNFSHCPGVFRVFIPPPPCRVCFSSLIHSFNFDQQPRKEPFLRVNSEFDYDSVIQISVARSFSLRFTHKNSIKMWQTKIVLSFSPAEFCDNLLPSCAV